MTSHYQKKLLPIRQARRPAPRRLGADLYGSPREFPRVVNEPRHLATAHKDAPYPFNQILADLQTQLRIAPSDLTDISIRSSSRFSVLRSNLIKLARTAPYKDMICHAYGGQDKVARILAEADKNGMLCDNYMFIVFYNALAMPSVRGRYCLGANNDIQLKELPQRPVFRPVHSGCLQAARGRVHHKDGRGLSSCIIPTSGKGLLCGFNAMASGIAQLSAQHRHHIYGVLGLTRDKIRRRENALAREGALKGSAGNYQRKLGGDLHEYSLTNHDAQMDGAAQRLYQAQVRELGFDHEGAHEAAAWAHQEAVDPINVGADRLFILADLIGVTVILNEADPPPEGSFIHIYNPSGGHYSAINTSKVDYSPPSY